MDEILQRFWTDLVERIGGPVSTRLVLQPLTAILLATRSGFRDARTGRRPYLVVLISGGSESRDQLRHGWEDIGRVFVMALVIDAIYQAFVLHWFYPGEALITAVVLAIVPYALMRGPAARLARRWL
ncbi:MAG: hypothetical protein IPF53_22040 [Blastocatellia bacterium]|nr:hypothetical protein [Blastocatellia bacterium]